MESVLTKTIVIQIHIAPNAPDKYHTSDGKCRWVCQYPHVKCDDNGNPWICTIRDRCKSGVCVISLNEDVYLYQRISLGKYMADIGLAILANPHFLVVTIYLVVPVY
jgi:MinD superfamily P-loop ATPase